MEAWKWRAWLAAAGALVTISSASTGAAQQCANDADCGAGYVCHVQTGTICSASCRSDESCPPPTCQTYTEGYCENAPCDGDADCPAPMLCHAEQVAECEEYACADEANCNAPPPSCREYTVTSCRQPYELPCRADADCGPGFRCVEEVIRWCNGSAPRNPGDGGVVTPSPEPECGEDRTGEYSCELQELPCTTDAECPLDFVCVEQPTAICRDAGRRPSGSNPTPGQTPVSDEDPASDEGATPSACPPPPPARSLCQPSRWWRGGSSVDEGESGGGKDAGTSTGGGTSEQPTAEEDEGSDDPDHVDGPRDRPRGRGAWIRKWLRTSHGCSVADHDEANTIDLSFVLALGSIVSLARRRRR